MEWPFYDLRVTLDLLDVKTCMSLSELQPKHGDSLVHTAPNYTTLFTLFTIMLSLISLVNKYHAYHRDHIHLQMLPG